MIRAISSASLKASGLTIRRGGRRNKRPPMKFQSSCGRYCHFSQLLRNGPANAMTGKPTPINRKIHTKNQVPLCSFGT